MGMFTSSWLRDTAERVVRSVVAAVISALVLTGPLNLHASKLLLFVAITAGLTVLKTALSALIPVGTEGALFGGHGWGLDAFERLLATFLEVAIAALLTGGSYDLSSLRTALLAGLAAVCSLLISLLALPTINTLSPASLVKATPRQAARRTPRHDL